eukprot:2877347-Rhodomonas_salina.1
MAHEGRVELDDEEEFPGLPGIASYAMSGTQLAYATRRPVPKQRMLRHARYCDSVYGGRSGLPGTDFYAHVRY